MTDLAPMYAVAVAAILLSLVAWIGLFSNLLGVWQILALASALVLTILLLLTRHHSQHR
ncbi:MAG: hypothetical protein JO352_31245 [Chloroflexi bacterium]|nr:hypothetical protein [Chloroflexota bacterium]